LDDADVIVAKEFAANIGLHHRIRAAGIFKPAAIATPMARSVARDVALVPVPTVPVAGAVVRVVADHR